jgi:CubicO group peptidase (beta-lactamase class C family)
MPVAAYLQEKIWQPLGMAYPGSWSLDEAGFEKMESGINGRAIDFAKFGRLYLHQGNWEGEQIVPADWVWESTAPAGVVNRPSYYPDIPFFADGRGYYKYMWWGVQREDGYDLVALGNHGQFLYISPAKELIIVRHGERYGRFGGPFAWVDLFYDVAGAFPDPE